MAPRGTLIYARLFVKHSYRAGHDFKECNFYDIVGGENQGDNQTNYIHLHFDREPERDRHELLHAHERYERLRKRYHERYGRLRKRYQHERERRKRERHELKHERRQRKRERRHNEKLSRKVRHLERRTAALEAIVLGTA